MRAAYVTQPGPAETLKVGELPTPTAGPGQCLVRIAASAVNPLDTGEVHGGMVADAGPGGIRFSTSGHGSVRHLPDTWRR